MYSGQGSKVCPFADQNMMRMPHTSASREAVKTRLLHDKEARLQGKSPWRDIFRKTLSFITALRKSGCRAPMHEATHRSLNEEFQYEIDLAHEAKLQRGYTSSETRCDGRLLFDYDDQLQPYIR
jgi:hypothetical protein